MQPTLEILDARFKEYWQKYMKEKPKQEEWILVQEERHNCPDCDTLIKVVIERHLITNKQRTRIEFLEHRV